jgi:ferredoxin
VEAGPVRARPEHSAGDLVSVDPAAGRWRVTVDTGRCLGSGSCCGVAPTHFALTGATAEAAGELVQPDERVIDAAELCPGTAITVRDAVSGALLAPG